MKLFSILFWILFIILLWDGLVFWFEVICILYFVGGNWCPCSNGRTSRHRVFNLEHLFSSHPLRFVQDNCEISFQLFTVEIFMNIFKRQKMIQIFYQGSWRHFNKIYRSHSQNIFLYHFKHSISFCYHYHENSLSHRLKHFHLN